MENTSTNIHDHSSSRADETDFVFKIVVPAYNCSEWLCRCLDSVERQTFKKFDLCVIDDASTDVRQKEIIQSYCARNGWQFILNDVNKGALYNIAAGIEALTPNDEDVIVTLDGDDWLFGVHVLKKIFDIYAHEDVFLTYGQYVNYPRWSIGRCMPLTVEEVDGKLYRSIDWKFGHLRTFKYFLWRRIRREDFLDRDGNFYRISGDLAFMYPMLEMAGHHVRFVSDILYVYNRSNPLNDFKVNLQGQRNVADDIRNKKPYECVLPGRVSLGRITPRTRLYYALFKIYWKSKRELGLA